MLPVTVALPLAVNVTIDVVPVEVIPVNPVAFVPLNTASRFDIVVSELTLVVDLNVAMSEALSYVESLSVSINVAIWFNRAVLVSVNVSTYNLLTASSLWVGLELRPRITVVEFDDPILMTLVPDVAKFIVPVLVPLLPKSIAPVEKSPVIKLRSVIDVKSLLPSTV